MAGYTVNQKKRASASLSRKYWYYLASPPLVLDHPCCSVTLKLTFLNSREPRQSLPRAEEEQ